MARPSGCGSHGCRLRGCRGCGRLAALPADLHPLEFAGFMTAPDPDLAVADEPLSPRDWLIGGGDASTVVELIEHFDAW